jgi:histidinol phosphatase-like enzyme
MHILLDLDRTLIDTSSVEEHMRDSRGRDYVANNITRFLTDPYHEDLAKLLNKMANHSMVSIVTNSPKHYARAVLKKHGFSQDIPLLASANKPHKENLAQFIKRQGIDKSKSIIIGDSTRDIMVAHELGVVSAITTYHTKFNQAKIDLSEPTYSIDKIEDLLEILDNGQLEDDDFEYEPRQRLDKLQTTSFGFADHFNFPDVKIIKLGDYIASRYFNDPHYKYSDEVANSKRILDYKETKGFTLDEIKRGVYNKYFWNGTLNNSQKVSDIIMGVKNELVTKLSQVTSDTLIVASPNSLPHYCYLFDTNRAIAIVVGNKIDSLDYATKRLIERIHPKSKSTSGGDRSIDSQISTLALNPSYERKDYKNILIFDDVSTTNSQIQSVAYLLQKKGFTGNFYGLVIGQTNNLY